MRPLRFAVFLVLLGCGGGSAADAGSDAASALDAGGEDGGGADAGVDAGAARDAGGDDAGADAGRADAGRADAGAPLDAGTCDVSAVRFVYLASGPLAVGTLCDDVFVCVNDAAEEARVVAASSRFACMPTPEGPCGGITCAYRDPGGPSTLDAAELAEICAVTLVSPPPDVVCAVYGP